MTDKKDRKDKILRGCNGIPTQSLLNYIQQGEVTLPELREAGLMPDKARALIQLKRAQEEAAWETATQTGSTEAYQEYLRQYPTGSHSGDAQAFVGAADEQAWLNATSLMNEASLNSYLQAFAEGMHADECRDLLADLPWVQTRNRGTLQAYHDYQAQWPDKHQAEVAAAVSDLTDDLDWQSACASGETTAYQSYIAIHPQGRHTAEASQRIAAAAHRQEYVSKMQADPNAFGAKELQEMVENNVIRWDDVTNVYGEERTKAIRLYQKPADLPFSMPPAALGDHSTEVYFWGTPSSGKTCALGAILSSVQRKGIFSPELCAGYDYMTRLSNIFGQAGYCTFPESTSFGNIQEMRMLLKDEDKATHHVTLIDLAGELFRSAYFKLHGLFLQDEQQQALDTALTYLGDRRNRKIHFFVVEYDAHNRQWNGLSMANYLDNMVLYLKQQGIFRKTTDGVYVLVTKCDKIPCTPDERPQKAYEYVRDNLLSFYNTLQDVCHDAGVNDLKVLAFSVGDVFAQNLCEFDGTDTEKVVAKLFDKTRAEKKGWRSILRG